MWKRKQQTVKEMGLSRDNVRILGLYIVLLFIGVFASIFSIYFRSLENIFNVIAQIVPLGFVALGQTIVLITAGVDLSVGGIVSISTAICAKLIYTKYTSVAIAFLLSLLFGTIFGYINGVMRTKLRIDSFIATLCTMLITQGVALAILPRPGGYISAELISFISLEKDILRLPIVYFALTFLVIYVFLKYHPLGRYFYAVGGNSKAANASGLNVDAIIIKAHIMCSILAAIGGLFLVARIKSGDPNVGSPFVLDSIVAVLIGGTTFIGGKGSIVGTLAGVLILGIISNVLNMYGINPFYQYIIKGIIFVIAVSTYRYKGK